MELDTLKKLLEDEKDGIARHDIEQLRLILGVARHFVRVVEKEINRRDASVDHSGLKYL